MRVPAQAYIDELAQTLMEGADDPSTLAHARMVELINANVGPCLLTTAVIAARLAPTVLTPLVVPALAVFDGVIKSRVRGS